MQARTLREVGAEVARAPVAGEEGPSCRWYGESPTNGRRSPGAFGLISGRARPEYLNDDRRSRSTWTFWPVYFQCSWRLRRIRMNGCRLVLSLSAIVLLIGCEGTMRGVMRGEGTPVRFTYQQGMGSDALTAVVDGETFDGRAVMADSRSTFGTAFANTYGPGGSAFGSGTVFGTSTSGRFVATLLGSRGSTMNCRLQYADSSGFTTSGGVGVCQHSDGRVIDVLW